VPQWLRPELCERLSQGDLFGPGWDAGLETPQGRIVVLTHNCEIEKTTGILVASYILKENADPGLWGGLVKETSARGWIIPGVVPEGYVNFRTIRSMPLEILNSRLDKRLHSMTPDGRDVLALRLFLFLRRHLPEESYDQVKEDRV
jgi:hypothetical protein